MDKGISLATKREADADAGRAEVWVIAPVEDSAQVLDKRLRARGLNVRTVWLDNGETLGKKLAGNQAEPAIICCQSKGKQDDLERLVSLCATAAKGIPVVALVGEKDSRDPLAPLMNAGASEVASLGDLDHAELALARELSRSNLRRELRKYRHQVEQMDNRLKAVLSESQMARAYIHEGIHTQLNPVYGRMFGFDDPDELVGVPLMDLVAQEDRPNVKARLNAAMKGRGTEEFFAFQGQKADDSVVSLNMRCRTEVVEGEEMIEILVTPGAATVSTTVSSASNALEGRVALYDALTDTRGLRLSERNAAIFYVAVDEIASLQDRVGLMPTDRVLNELSAFLLNHLDAEDRSFRFAVNDFVIVAFRQTSAELEDAAEGLRGAIDAQVFGDEDVSAPLTASIAVVSLTDEGSNLALLLQAMRMAYKASARSGNTVVVESTSERKLSARELDRKWLERLQRSIAEDRFSLVYQSIASLEGDSAENYDVYIRLVGDKGELVRPGEFMGTAERHGLMPAIDQWVLRSVIDVIRARSQRGEASVMFVKLSMASVDESEQLLQWLDEALGKSKIDPKSLVLALDESTVQTTVKKSRALIDQLRERRLRVALHGFGASAKSQQMLEMTGAEFVRLDVSFTQSLVSSENDPAIARMIENAHDLDAKIIAAQVEDANSMARLWQAGVNYVQGYYVQEPGASAQAPNLHIV